MQPYTIRIFVPDGNPQGLKIIDKMNWTGAGLSFSRSDWQKIKKRPEFLKAGIYILVGHSEDENDPRPIIYIGQADGLKSRIDNHDKNKDFWSWATVFVSTNDGLNRAHITWIEHALIDRANKYQQAIIDNSVNPQEPILSESEKADTNAFLQEMLQIMPLIGLQSFDEPKIIASPNSKKTDTMDDNDQNTIIVPAKAEGFKRVFLGEDCWYAIRIAGGMLKKIKYIAAYRSNPISAITHIAPVSKIVPYGDTGKYKVVFSSPAEEIKHIPFGSASSGTMQGTRYANLNRIKAAKEIKEIF